MLTTRTASLALRTIGTVVLARLLAPHDFGLVAMVLAITNFGALFKDLGLSEAVVQKETVTHEQVSTLFWINVVFGSFIAVALAALSPVVAWFYGDRRLLAVTCAMATVFVLGSGSIQHRALLRRHMRFTSLGIIEMAASCLAVTVAIATAVLGAGYWSLVLLHVSVAFFSTLGSWAALLWMPGWPHRKRGARQLLGFGGNIAGHNLAYYFSRNADKLLIGRVLGPAALGFYAKADALLMLPILQIRTPLIHVGLSSLSRLNGKPQEYCNYYEKLLQMLAFVALPIVFLLGVHASEVVLLVLGDQWLPSAEVFRILSFAALVQVVEGTSGMVMLSSGDSRRYFKLGAFRAVANVFSFLVGLPWGIRGVALSYTLLNYLLLLPILTYSFKHAAVDVTTFFRAVLLPFAAAALAASASRGVFVLLQSSIHMWQALILALVGATLAYVIAYLIIPGGTRVLKQVRTSLNYVISPAAEPAR